MNNGTYIYQYEAVYEAISKLRSYAKEIRHNLEGISKDFDSMYNSAWVGKDADNYKEQLDKFVLECNKFASEGELEDFITGVQEHIENVKEQERRSALEASKL